jgi:hypothetical protein
MGYAPFCARNLSISSSVRAWMKGLVDTCGFEYRTSLLIAGAGSGGLRKPELLTLAAISASVVLDWVLASNLVNSSPIHPEMGDRFLPKS